MDEVDTTSYFKKQKQEKPQRHNERDESRGKYHSYILMKYQEKSIVIQLLFREICYIHDNLFFSQSSLIFLFLLCMLQST